MSIPPPLRAVLQYHTLPACKLGAIFHNPSLRYDSDCYVIRNAVYITIIKDALQSSTIICICYLTPWLTWLASVATHKLRFHASHTQTIIESCSILDNHGTSQPLPWCRQWEPFIFQSRGQLIIIFIPPLSHSAQERPFFRTYSTTPKVPIPYTKNRSASCSLSGIYQNIPGSFPPGTHKEERRIWGIMP